MKTIHIRFARPGEAPFCTVTGRFASLPGDGALSWSGDMQAFADAIGSKVADLPMEHYADNFQSALAALAMNAGLQALVTETGDWAVYSE